MKNKSNVINFVMNIDETYIQQCTVTMTSILVNLNKIYKANFYVFFLNFNKKPREFIALEKKFACKIICIDLKKFKSFFNKTQLEVLQKSDFQNYWKSLASLYRLLMFKFLPKQVDYACYIDADIIVDTDLSNIYNDFVQKKLFFGSVVDVVFLKRWKINKKIYINYPEFNKLISDRLSFPYFCAGFYIANICKCKQLNVFDQLLSFYKKHPNIQLADQDILNSVFSQKYSNLITYFPPTYDVFIVGTAREYSARKKFYYSKKQMKNAYKYPKVLHFAGPNKPWLEHKICRGAKKWWFYYDKSPAKLPRVKLSKKD